MIKLDEPVATFWLPDGDGRGNPQKATADLCKVQNIRIDYHSRTLEVSAMHGFIDPATGQFRVYQRANGTIDILSQVVAADGADPHFTNFIAAVGEKGAKNGNFRIEDVEDLLIEKGIVKGTRVQAC